MTVYVSRSISEVLDRLNWDIVRKFKRIYIKINMVSAYNVLSMTPPDAVKELVTFLREKINYDGKIIIAEGSALGSTYEGFRNANIIELAKQYDIELFDIHEDSFFEVPLFNHRFEEISIPVSKSLANAEFLISICRAKTHDTVIVTLTLKNVAVGGIVGKNYRGKIHQGYPAINVNIAILSGILFPDIGIVDGKIGMEGDGPVSGTPKSWGYVFAGNNPLEVDAIVSRAMGFDPNTIGYLYYLTKLGFGKINDIDLMGFSLDDISTRFRPHREYKNQLNWKLDPEFEEEILKKSSNIIKKYSRKTVI